MIKLIRIILGKILLTLDSRIVPKGTVRSSEKQAQVDLETNKLALYQFESCPFCIKVRRTMKELSLKIEFRDVRKVEKYRDELLQKGGMYQVPCLRIDYPDGSVQWMYESSEINRYLRHKFAEQSPLKH